MPSEGVFNFFSQLPQVAPFPTTLLIRKMRKLKKEIAEHDKYFTTEIFSATLKEVSK